MLVSRILRRSRNLFLLGLVITALSLFTSGQALANPGSLSGTVTDSANNKIANVQIQVIDSSNNVVASATTGVDGKYNIASVADGTYTVRAIPPGGSGFSQATLLNVVVSGPTIRDIVLGLRARAPTAGPSATATARASRA